VSGAVLRRMGGTGMAGVGTTFFSEVVPLAIGRVRLGMRLRLRRGIAVLGERGCQQQKDCQVVRDLCAAQHALFLPSQLIRPRKCARESSVVPPGLEFSLPLSPALKRWAKFVRPSGAGFSAIPFHRIAREPILTHTLKGRLIFKSLRYR